MSISKDLTQQYGHALDMLKNGIEQCPEDQWNTVVDDPFFVPARVAFHIIQAVDFFISPIAAEFDWKAFGFNWEETPAESLPSKSVVSDYLDKVQSRVASYFNSADDASMLGSDAQFSPRFESPLARLMYSIRHAHHHIGQLSLDLQRRGLPEIKW